jgi:alginate O-acetyltransferase complex protein AlgI
MQFMTLQFFIFFVGVFLLAILFKESKKYYRIFLLVVSLSLYFFFGINFFLILVANILINYLLLRGIGKFGKKIFILSIIINILFLAGFKYYNFGIDSLLQSLDILNISANIQVLRILIPVGISFYTFRNISHLVDCYKKELPIPSLIDYANYVAFFPQIMSGPIVRAKDFYPFLHDPGVLGYSQGRIITLFLSGLIKKYVIASYLFDIVSGPFASPMNYSPTDLMFAAVAYSIMIYVDFSGYSDFAVAISNLLGFDVQPNFKSPYAAVGLKDFWNRWHISLSSWLKDYVYIPLGGNRSIRIGFWKINTWYAKYFNILATMFLSGLWHGAGINFMVWGLLHGIGSMVTHLVNDIFAKKSNSAGEESMVPDKYAADDKSVKSTLSHNSKRLVVDINEHNLDGDPVSESGFDSDIANLRKDSSRNILNSMTFFVARIFGWTITFIYITFAWIFFASTTFQSAIDFIWAIFKSPTLVSKVFDLRALALIVIVLLFNLIGGKAFRLIIRFFDEIPLIIRIPFVAVVLYFILQLGPDTVPPFIYFNF